MLHDIRYCQFIRWTLQVEGNRRMSDQPFARPFPLLNRAYPVSASVEYLPMRGLLRALFLYKSCVKERPVTPSGRNDETSRGTELKSMYIDSLAICPHNLGQVSARGLVTVDHLA